MAGKNSGSSIRNCDCKSDYQDALYGKGKRVKNSMTQGAKCTICGKEEKFIIKSDKKSDDSNAGDTTIVVNKGPAKAITAPKERKKEKPTKGGRGK